MKVLLYGEAHKFASGAWCYAEALKDMGHEVVDFPDDFALEAYRRSILLKVCRKITRRPLEHHRRTHIDALLSEVDRARPKLLLVLKGLWLGPNEIDAIKARGVIAVNINHDDFFSSNRNNWSKLQRAALSAYDYVFVTREVNVEEVRPFNSRVDFFPFAYYPRIHRPFPLADGERPDLRSDVLFVGTWERSRAALLEVLVRNVRARYLIYGTQWQKVSRGSELRKYVSFRELVGDDMAKAIGAAKITLGFLRKENRDDYTQRTFEIPACNGVLLAERTQRHSGYFREGAEAEFFDVNSPDELCRKVTYLLSNNSARENMRAAGHQALLSQKHTYQDRLKRLFEVCHSLTGKLA